MSITNSDVLDTTSEISFAEQGIAGQFLSSISSRFKWAFNVLDIKNLSARCSHTPPHLAGKLLNAAIIAGIFCRIIDDPNTQGWTDSVAYATMPAAGLEWAISQEAQRIYERVRSWIFGQRQPLEEELPPIIRAKTDRI